MTDRKQQIIDRAVEQATKALIDKGKLVEAGFAAFRIQAIPANAGQMQIEQMLLAFIAGAQHLYASIMTTLDEGAEPTDMDLRRMGLIHDELERWRPVIEAVVEQAKRARGDA